MHVEASWMRDVIVLCYHALSDDWPAALSTTPDRFRAQLELLLARGYRPATFAQAVTEPHAGRTVAVTFDDAYRSVLERARPIMDALGVPGTVFVPTDWADSPEPMRWEGIDQWLDGPHEHEMRCLRWEELRELAKAGWEVGSHTCSHPHLSRLDDAALEQELGASRIACTENLGTPCRSIAYPYGDVDPRVVEATRSAGYELGAALPKQFASTDPLDWPRVGVYHGDDIRRFKLKVSWPLRRLRGSVLWRAAVGERR
jgi:peptidoglycan/xylan/chitin deacetylase (PgdA/CDA1 family)